MAREERTQEEREGQRALPGNRHRAPQVYLKAWLKTVGPQFFSNFEPSLFISLKNCPAFSQ